MRTTRDCAGTEASSGRLPSDESKDLSTRRPAAWIGRYIRQDSSARGDSGAAVVEMAFIFGILIMLLVGVVTSAIAFGQKNQIENAAREASRYAATYPPPTADPAPPNTWDAWLEDVRAVAQAAAQGNLDGSVDGQYICVYHAGANRRLVQVGGAAPTYSNDVCYNDGLTDVRVQVETRRDTEINAAFFSVDVTLNAPATARYEREG